MDKVNWLQMPSTPRNSISQILKSLPLESPQNKEWEHTAERSLSSWLRSKMSSSWPLSKTSKTKRSPTRFSIRPVKRMWSKMELAEELIPREALEPICLASQRLVLLTSRSIALVVSIFTHLSTTSNQMLRTLSIISPLIMALSRRCSSSQRWKMNSARTNYHGITLSFHATMPQTPTKKLTGISFQSIVVSPTSQLW